MKIRSGFVSNSSSASFAVIGVSKDDIILEIIKALNLEICSMHRKKGSSWEVTEEWYEKKWESCAACGRNWPYKTLEKPLKCYPYREECGFYCIGFDAESILQDQSIQDAKKELQEFLKSIGVKVPLKDIGFEVFEGAQ